MTETYRFITNEAPTYPTAILCRLLGVSRSGYYAWKERPERQDQLQGGQWAYLATWMDLLQANRISYDGAVNAATQVRDASFEAARLRALSTVVSGVSHNIARDMEQGLALRY